MKEGTIRIKKNLIAYKKTKSRWNKTNQTFPNILKAVKLYKAEKNFKELLDGEFLKGALSPEGMPIGKRINSLPNKEKLEKAFSLFSQDLTFHDQTTHDHWDVLYKNKGGTFSYIYTLKKRKEHQNKKYKKVEEFTKVYKKLLSSTKKQLDEEIMALVLYTLLKTFMRVGNETYYKAHGHKGLTTLTKKDIKIKENKVHFTYIGKDGVPLSLNFTFPPEYRKKLNSQLKTKKEKEFVFSKGKHAISEEQFKKAFINYCGKEFYPHIVRSYYATNKVKKFIEKNKSVTKKDLQKLFLEIAHVLGHKKFNKKKQQWEENYAVTVHSYVQPDLISKLNTLLVD